MDFSRTAKVMALAVLAEETRFESHVDITVVALIESLADYLKDFGAQVQREGKLVTARIGDHTLKVRVNSPEWFTLYDGPKLALDCDENEMMREVVVWLKTIAQPLPASFAMHGRPNQDLTHWAGIRCPGHLP
ncbi:MAG: hypothetical protein EPO41_26185 [Reyranella sp.]|uniref:hypothetical protein n=1 Tax=Reyranella sp. TaxID=1929291 RepID=UPI00120306C9|nr:hypothetical protein [Reyranella sp.]TAJ85505.1 MAG: hypothetical protein EPO41_26185 [Reyranella sp.]